MGICRGCNDIRSCVYVTGRSLAVCMCPPGLGYGGPPSSTRAQADRRLFPETGHSVQGRFLRYWEAQGGLVQQGYPLTEELTEVSLLDGKTYTVQYFERAVFEDHPENAGTPYEVLLAQLGTYELHTRYPADIPASTPNPQNARRFTETGHSVGGLFRTYWEAHGGLAQQGYPLTDEFTEVSTLDGRYCQLKSGNRRAGE